MKENKSEHKSENMYRPRRNSSSMSITSHKSGNWWMNLHKQLQIMLASKIKTGFIIESYNKAINDASIAEHSYKQLTHQFLQKQAEYDELVKQRDNLQRIRMLYDEENIDPSEWMSEGSNYMDIDKSISSNKILTTEYVNSYQKFTMSIESYLCEALSQITYKLYKIKNHTDVEYPKEIDLLIKAFNTQYEK